MKVNLPMRARAASWKIKSVEISYLKREPLTVRYAEVNFPELMQGNHVMYSLNSEGNTVEPRRTLRFYFNNYSNDQTENYSINFNTSNHRAITSKPDLDLGYHILDNLELSMEMILRRSNDVQTTSSPYAFNIILEYNE